MVDDTDPLDYIDHTWVLGTGVQNDYNPSPQQTTLLLSPLPDEVKMNKIEEVALLPANISSNRAGFSLGILRHRGRYAFFLYCYAL